jgi:hypothetical protein
MGSSGAITSIAIAIIAFSLSACDQIGIGSRYELSKDSKGRTLRLDKRTGEMVVIDGDRIISLRDAREDERKEREAAEQVGKFKYWPVMQLENFRAEVGLTTVWRDGHVLYAVEFRPSRKSGSKDQSSTSGDKKVTPQEKFDSTAIIQAIEKRKFFLIFFDVPFELAREELNFSRVVDEKNKPIALTASGRITMSREAYQKVDEWNVRWR